MAPVACILDPWSPALYNDGLFVESHPLNRDHVFTPWIALRDAFAAQGIETHTVDFLLQGRVKPEDALYYSIGQRQNWPLLKAKGVKLKAYWQLEPPVVDPHGYKALPLLLRNFESVYTHDPETMGGEKLHWPQVMDRMLPDDGRPRKRLCAINGNKSPHPDFIGTGELYSERIRAFDYFGDAIDLYGPGWEGRPNWKGAPADKFEVLRGYDFAVCFENQELNGYLTEKLPECLFAGCVPIYWGAPDIMKYVPPMCFVPYHTAEVEVADSALLRRPVIAAYLASERFRPFTSKAFAERIVSKALAV